MSLNSPLLVDTTSIPSDSPRFGTEYGHIGHVKGHQTTSSRAPILPTLNLHSPLSQLTQTWVDDRPILMISVGDRVRLKRSGMEGTVAFVGPTHFAAGDMAGIILDRRKGRHDGEAYGIRYFHCEPNHGLFCALDNLEELNCDSLCPSYQRREQLSAFTPRSASSTDTHFRFPRKRSLVRSSSARFHRSSVISPIDHISPTSPSTTSNYVTRFNRSKSERLSNNRPKWRYPGITDAYLREQDRSNQGENFTFTRSQTLPRESTRTYGSKDQGYSPTSPMNLNHTMYQHTSGSLTKLDKLHPSHTDTLSASFSNLAKYLSRSAYQSKIPRDSTEYQETQSKYVELMKVFTELPEHQCVVTPSSPKSPNLKADSVITCAEDRLLELQRNLLKIHKSKVDIEKDLEQKQKQYNQLKATYDANKCNGAKKNSVTSTAPYLLEMRTKVEAEFERTKLLWLELHKLKDDIERMNVQGVQNSNQLHSPHTPNLMSIYEEDNGNQIDGSQRSIIFQFSESNMELKDREEELRQVSTQLVDQFINNARNFQSNDVPIRDKSHTPDAPKLGDLREEDNRIESADWIARSPKGTKSLLSEPNTEVKSKAKYLSELSTRPVDLFLSLAQSLQSCNVAIQDKITEVKSVNEKMGKNIDRVQCLIAVENIYSKSLKQARHEIGIMNMDLSVVNAEIAHLASMPLTETFHDVLKLSSLKDSAEKAEEKISQLEAIIGDLRSDWKYLEDRMKSRTKEYNDLLRANLQVHHLMQFEFESRNIYKEQCQVIERKAMEITAASEKMGVMSHVWANELQLKLAAIQRLRAKLASLTDGGNVTNFILDANIHTQRLDTNIQVKTITDRQPMISFILPVLCREVKRLQARSVNLIDALETVSRSKCTADKLESIRKLVGRKAPTKIPIQSKEDVLHSKLHQSLNPKMKKSIQKLKLTDKRCRTKTKETLDILGAFEPTTRPNQPFGTHLHTHSSAFSNYSHILDSSIPEDDEEDNLET